MAKIVPVLLLSPAFSIGISACNKDGDLWDRSNYFGKHRAQPPGQEKRLRDRLRHPQSEFQWTSHQTSP